MRLPDDVKDGVAFLCVSQAGRMKYGGTCFFVSLKSEKFPELSWRYFVTAKHCIEAAQRHGDLFMRINLDDGGSRTIKLSGSWKYSENESVDAAVMPFDGSSQDIKCALIDVEMFATTQAISDNHIGIGDELFIVGLFMERHGLHRNIPIVRTGIIAAMPEEPLIDDRTGQEFDAYLAEVRSIGGLSGSPVFASLSWNRMAPVVATLGNVRFFLLGLIRGHWDLKQTGEMDFLDEADAKLNTGIAIVTPIQEVWNIIMHHKDLRKKREADERAHAQKHAPTLDSGFIKPAEFTRKDFESALKKVSRKRTPKRSA